MRSWGEAWERHFMAIRRQVSYVEHLLQCLRCEVAFGPEREQLHVFKLFSGAWVEGALKYGDDDLHLHRNGCKSM